jgi:hypothetical protein
VPTSGLDWPCRYGSNAEEVIGTVVVVEGAEVTVVLLVLVAPAAVFVIEKEAIVDAVFEVEATTLWGSDSANDTVSMEGFAPLGKERMGGLLEGDTAL